MAPVHVRDAVMAGQRLVEEGMVGGQQVDHAAILAQLTRDEELRFLDEGTPEVLGELAEGFGVRLYGLDLPEVEPLVDEVDGERLRPRIAKHAPRLRFE